MAFEPQKRGPGRPRKHPRPEPVQTAQPEPAQPEPQPESAERRPECATCDGGGQVVDNGPGVAPTPWTRYTDRPQDEALVVTMGLITPATCPDCGGNGKR